MPSLEGRHSRDEEPKNGLSQKWLPYGFMFLPLYYTYNTSESPRNAPLGRRKSVSCPLLSGRYQRRWWLRAGRAQIW